MARPAPEQALQDSAEDLWLACHDLWLQPVEWWTAWWNACAQTMSLHRTLRAPDLPTRHHHAVPEPDADLEHNLFA